ncbi:MAG: hypothetical protein AAF570_12095 [Bacteroidota bacterium]
MTIKSFFKLPNAQPMEKEHNKSEIEQQSQGQHPLSHSGFSTATAPPPSGTGRSLSPPAFGLSASPAQMKPDENAHENEAGDKDDNNAEEALHIPRRFTRDGKLLKVWRGEATLKSGDSGPHIIKLRQALADMGYMKVTDVHHLYNAYMENAVKRLQTRAGFSPGEVNGEINQKTFKLFHKVFDDFKAELNMLENKSQTELHNAVRPLRGQDKTEVKKAVTVTPSDMDEETGKASKTALSTSGTTGSTSTSTSPAVTPASLSPEERAKAKKQYHDTLYRTLENLIISQYNRIGKGRLKQHYANDKYPMDEVVSLTNVAKAEADRVFSKYIQNAPAVIEEDKHVKDLWDERIGNWGETFKKRDWARGRIIKMLKTKPQPARVERKFRNQLTADERSFQRNSVVRKLAKKYKEQLFHVWCAWPGRHENGKMFLQRFRAKDDAKNKGHKDYRWRNFFTAIHEYMHFVEHPRCQRFRSRVRERQGGLVLREGLADYFTKIVISSLDLNDEALRRRVEGPYYKPDSDYKVPDRFFYKVSEHAERLVGVVGFRNAAAAFFLGKVELLGGTAPPNVGSGSDDEFHDHHECDH